MKAVILVGGEGTRLRPLTCNTPKPMIPVVNRPFLEYTFDYLKGHGITDIILSMCYRPDIIEKQLGDGRQYGVRLTYVAEETPLGTAGAVKNVEQYLDDTCFVFNGDILTDLDLTAMLAHHREREAKVTISLTPVEDPTAYGLVEMDGDCRVVRFIEKPGWDSVTTNLINAGTYVVEPEVFRYVPPQVHYMFERGLFPVLLQTEDPIYGYPSNAYWIDIGTPERYIAVHHDLLMGKVAIKMPGQRLQEGIWIGEGCSIDPTAKLAGPIVLGNGVAIGQKTVVTGPAVLGDHCRVGRDSVIEDAVVWAGTTIGNHVMMKRCVVGRKSIIDDNSWVTGGTIVADGCTIGAGNKLEHAIKVWPGKTIEANAITF